MRARILLSSCIVAAAAFALAATAQEPPQQTRAGARSQAESTRAFLNHRQSEQAQRNGRIADQANLRELNGIVRAASLALPSPSFVTDQTQLTALRESFLVDVAKAWRFAASTQETYGATQPPARPSSNQPPQRFVGVLPSKMKSGLPTQ